MPTVLSVGQCGFDGPRIERWLRREVGVEVDSADTAAEARELVARRTYDVVLVNRELARDGSSGIALVGEMVRCGCPSVLLVSDRPEAQAQAREAGAKPGFGKASLNHGSTANLVRKLCGTPEGA